MVRKLKQTKENYTHSFGELAIASKGNNVFLETAEKILNWDAFENIFENHRNNSNFGASSYSKILMFKIMLLQTWYNLSDPQVEEEIKDKISFIKFLKISLDSQTPDHSTISRFRKFVLKEKLHDKLFQEVNRQLERQNIIIRTGAIVDASVVQSSRANPIKVIEGVEDRKEETILLETDEAVEENTTTDDTSTDAAQYNEVLIKGDSDAGWIKKGKKGWTHGFKIHNVVNEEGYYLGGHVTAGNKSDMNELEQMVKESNLPKGTEVMADKGYASKSNREMLIFLGFVDGIMNKAVRGKELTHEEKLRNKEISKKRYVVEQSFGLLKQHFKFTRMRYLGLEKSTLENSVKMLSHNIKKATCKIIEIMKNGELEKKSLSLC